MAANSAQWIHMVGIAGAGMSGIARVLKEQGNKVTGSDLQKNDVSKKLEEIGIQIYEGHSSSNLQEGVDLLVISSAVPLDNIEVETAKKCGIPVLKRGEMLARMANAGKGVAVAGAHGKTTTTSMIYAALQSCGGDPTYIVGGELQDSDLNAHLGQGEYFVVEADESDASFLALHPYIAVVTNIEDDHLDFYKSFERIKTAFQTFLQQTDTGGFVLLNGGDPSLREIGRSAAGRVLFYGEDDSLDYHLRNWRVKGMGSVFEAYRSGEYLGQIELSVPGRHNAWNALAALAVAMELGCSFDVVAKSLVNFHGAKRRFQIMGHMGSNVIVDDYAHHPTEIRATIKAAHDLGFNRLVVVFQPHRYTRTKLLAEQFSISFELADLVIITDIYSAGEKPIAGIDSQMICKLAVQKGANMIYMQSQGEIEEFIRREIKNNELVITMGAGDIWKLGEKLADVK
ncbi:MAG TPA: UDP-N-acetylmuramate--L-alanine ligase [Syntrophomonas sp.]|nr:UDP-N-acetylmuramate--L-alanine ligase [Syntrophomonas sp.]